MEIENQGMGENGGSRRVGNTTRPNPTSFPMLKIEIPSFDGHNPQWWVRRCERMFNLYNVAEQQRVLLTAAYLNDARDEWYQGWSGVKEECSWGEFVEDLCERFGERGMLDVVEEFNKLKQ